MRSSSGPSSHLGLFFVAVSSSGSQLAAACPQAGSKRSRCMHRTAATWLRACAAAGVSLLATSVHATFHTYRIETVFSNADGSVQYIVLHETQGQPGQRLLASHALTSTHAG